MLRSLKHLIIGSALLFCFSLNSFAKVELPEIISDNMVLQQNSQATLWGWATAGKTVTVKTSWNKAAYTATVSKTGEWRLAIATPPAGFEPQQITITEGETVTLNNVLIGEVWLASGQSNMEMPLNGFWNCPIKEANTAIATATQNRARIRFVTIPKSPATTPQTRVGGSWKECTPENAQWFSATAYFYADLLSKTLDVPVGIINSSWGGSRVEGWSNHALNERYNENLADTRLLDGSEASQNWLRPLVMYNGMLHPLKNYTIKGFIWYQGCSNVGNETTYAERLANMVALWRSDFGNNELPFYYVQIAPYDYGSDNISGALLREAQYKAQKLIPNSGMIATNDLVEPFEVANIHPRNKIDVGRRLAYMALNRSYGQSAIRSNGPEYDHMAIEGAALRLFFNYANDGFNRDNGIEGFEIAGADKVFYPATAKIEIQNSIITVVVASDRVKSPAAVRYCFRNAQLGNLAGTRELPVVPFRTDNW